MEMVTFESNQTNQNITYTSKVFTFNYLSSTTSKMKGVMLRPKCSASTIANEAPDKYDIFAQVCGPGSYVPNTRLQQLLEAPFAEESATQFQCKMVRSLVSVDTFRKVDRDGEPLIGDHNLQRMLSIMAS